MNRSRIALIAVVAVAVFGGAFLLFRGDGDDTETTAASGLTPTTAAAAGGACGGVTARADTAYKVAFPSPPRADAGGFEVTVSRDGAPVKGAKVCFGGDMVGMSHPPVGGEATEVADGTYRFNAKFSMRGGWTGTVTVVPTGGSAVAIPVTFDVA